MSLIYLDFNRTTPIAPSVAEAMKPFWSQHFMLPSQGHAQGQAVGEALENARESLGHLVGCEPFELVFTSGGTEANNLAIRGIANGQQAGHILVGATEHDSVYAPTQALGKAGWEVESIPVDSQGRIDPDHVADRIKPTTRLVCAQLANPILGTIQPLRELADRCHHHDVLVHCDAAAALGRIPVNAADLRVDTLAISGHKFFGPKGSGAIYVRRGLDLSPIMYGEPREMGLRPGAENVPACVGLGAAATLAAKYAGDAPAGLSELSDRFLNGIFDAIKPTPILLAQEAHRLPNTLALQWPGEARRISRAARQLAVAISKSAAPPDEMARILRAVGCTDQQIGRTIGIAIGWTTTRDQIDQAVSMLAEAWDMISG